MFFSEFLAKKISWYNDLEEYYLVYRGHFGAEELKPPGQKEWQVPTVEINAKSSWFFLQWKRGTNLFFFFFSKLRSCGCFMLHRGCCKPVSLYLHVICLLLNYVFLSFHHLPLQQRLKASASFELQERHTLPGLQSSSQEDFSAKSVFIAHKVKCSVEAGRGCQSSRQWSCLFTVIILMSQDWCGRFIDVKLLKK